MIVHTRPLDMMIVDTATQLCCTQT